jgi:hypothetical protein
VRRAMGMPTGRPAIQSKGFPRLNWRPRAA